MKHNACFILVLWLASLMVLSCGESEQPLTGTWKGNYTDTSLVTSLLVLKVLSGEKLTDKEFQEYAKFIEVHDVELRLEQDDTTVVGNLRIDGGEAIPIRNGSFVGNTFTFRYTQKHFLSHDEEIDVSAELTNPNALQGNWSDKGFWEVTKQ